MSSWYIKYLFLHKNILLGTFNCLYNLDSIKFVWIELNWTFSTVQNAFQLYTQNTFSTVQNAFQLCIILFQLYTECFFNCIHRLPGSFPFYSGFFADQSVATWVSRDFPTDCYWLSFEYLPANQLHPAGHVISRLLAIGYTLKISRPTSCTQGVTWFPHCLNWLSSQC